MKSHVGRVTGVPLEPRAALAHFDPATQRYTIYAGSGGAVRQKQETRRRPGHRSEECAGAVIRCRRQFRHPQSLLRRIRPGDVGLEEARPAGEIPRRALGSLPHRLSGPRSRHRSLARARQGWPLPRDAREQSQQCRRALRIAVAIEQRLGPDHRLLQYSDRDVARPRRVLQHHADAGLSQLRPAGSHLCDRAADRQGGARTRLRSLRIAPPQSGAAGTDALHQRRRLDLRQRRIRKQHGPRAQARRLRRLSGAARRGRNRAASCWALALPIMSSPRSARRRSAPI